MGFDLRALYDYAVWANGRVMAAAEKLTPEQWDRPLGHSFGSVHGTLVHILSSEQLWLARWQGHSPRTREITPENCPTLADLRARWAGVEHEMREFLGHMGPRTFSQDIAYTTLEDQPARYRLWQMYLQVINHGTHHRAEAATMLTELGAAPEPLDLIVFFREREADGSR